MKSKIEEEQYIPKQLQKNIIVMSLTWLNRLDWYPYLMRQKLINTCISNILRKFWIGLKTCSLSWFRHWGRVTHICVSKLTIIGSDTNKTHRVRYSVQLEPPKKSESEKKARVWRPLPWRFLRGFWLNRIPNMWCVFIFIPFFFLNSYFDGEHFLLS